MKLSLFKYGLLSVVILMLFACKGSSDGKISIGLIRKNIANFTTILTLSDSEYDNTGFVMKYYRTEDDLVKAMEKGKVQLAVLPFTRAVDNRLSEKVKLAMPVLRGGNFIVYKKGDDSTSDKISFDSKTIGYINKGLQKDLCNLVSAENTSLKMIEFSSERRMKSAYNEGAIDMMILDIPDAFKYSDTSVVSNYFLEKYPLYTSYDLLVSKDYIDNEMKLLIARMQNANSIINTYPDASYINFNQAFGIHHKFSQEALRSVSYVIQYTEKIREFQKKILQKNLQEQAIKNLYINMEQE